MPGRLFTKLALTNIGKNRKFYIPYLITCVANVSMFYIMASIVGSRTFPGGNTTKSIMVLGTIVIAIFSMLFLYYTNSFLIKRRKTELGIYNILGMEKRHIVRVLAKETLFTGLFSVTVGLVCGIVLDKLMFLVLLNLLHYDVTVKFEIVPVALISAVLLFAFIFCVILLSNAFQIYRVSPVELLHGSSVGEKEPKTKILLVVLGVLFLASGYAIAIFTTDIIDALTLFFIAVILVIAGTYCLFVAGSIAILKTMKKNKRYYYKPKNFVAVSGMLYRMKQNAVGLANICVLSTMVLVMISTTISLYASVQEMIDEQYPYDIEIDKYNYKKGEPEKLTEVINEVLEETGRTQSDVSVLETFIYHFTYEDGRFTPGFNTSDSEKYAYIRFVPCESYEMLTGDKCKLGTDEVAVFRLGKELPNNITIAGKPYSVKTWLTEIPGNESMENMGSDSYYVIMSDRDAFFEINEWIESNSESGDAPERLEYYFNIDGTDEEKLAFYTALSERINKFDEEFFAQYDETGYSSIYSKQDNIPYFYQIYGGFLFLGVFLGVLFMMATVLIIYYKQIIEGYEDKRRFDIMRKVGMSKRLISSSVKKQILTMFILPLDAAVVHLLFAFPMLSRVLQVLQLTNVKLFAVCTVLTTVVFSFAYVAVYLMTTRAYYGIVSQNVQE